MKLSDFRAEIVWLPIEQLIPYDNNPNKHPEAQIKSLASMMLAYGFDQPIVLDGSKVIIKGHGRRLAALHAGISPVPCILRTDLEAAVVRAARIADNEIARQSELDKLLLSREVLDIKDQSEELTKLLGFDDKALQQLLKPVVFSQSTGTTGNTDPDAVPKEAETRCKPGDLWTLGNHRLLCGDSTDGRHVSRLFGEAKAQLCFTSPPYADQREYNGGKDLSTQKLATFIGCAREHVNLFVVNLGMCRREGEVLQYWDDYIAEARTRGLKLLSWNVWDRGHPRSIGQQTAMFGIEHEFIFVFGEERKQLNLTVRNVSAGSKAGVSNRMADGSLSVKKPVEVREARQLGTIFRSGVETNSDHPAAFPTILPGAYIEACTETGDRVYEPFSGSGTTMIACEQLGRSCYGMEIDPRYADICLKRWEDFTGLQAVKAFNGDPA